MPRRITVSSGRKGAIHAITQVPLIQMLMSEQLPDNKVCKSALGRLAGTRANRAARQVVTRYMTRQLRAAVVNTITVCDKVALRCCFAALRDSVHARAEMADMHLVYGALSLLMSIIFIFSTVGEVILPYNLVTHEIPIELRPPEQTFPTRRHPGHRMFTSVDRQLHETGTFTANRYDTGVIHNVQTVRFYEEVLEHIADSPSSSTRGIARTIHASHQNVLRVMHEQRLRPYHREKVQVLHPADFQPRVNFAGWFLYHCAEEPSFSRYSLYIDEAAFTRCGVLSSRNSHVWNDVHPHAMVERHHQHLLLTSGPALDRHATLSLGGLGFTHTPAYVVNDGAPAHLGLEARHHFTATLCDRCIGRCGPVMWPPRFPDLTPPGFFLWAHLKTLLYETPVNTVAELRVQITRNTPHISARARQSRVHHCRLCIVAGGRHFEQHVLVKSPSTVFPFELKLPAERVLYEHAILSPLLAFIHSSQAVFIRHALHGGLRTWQATKYAVFHRNELHNPAYVKTPRNYFISLSRIFVDASLTLTYYSTLCVYIVFIATTTKQVADSYYPRDVPEKDKMDIRLYILMLSPIFYGLGLIRNLKHLVPFSMIANCFILTGFCIIVYYIFRDKRESNGIELITHDITTMPAFFSTVIFAIEGIGVVMPLENRMKNPGHFLGCPGVLNIGMTGVVLIYATIGLLGYLKYGQDAQASVSLNLPTEEILAQVVKLLIAAAIIVSYGLMFFIPTDITWALVEPHISERWKNIAQNIFRIATTTATIVIAIAVPNLGPIISLVGAVCFSTLGLLCPAVIDTAANWEDGLGRWRWVLWKNGFIVLFALLALFTGAYTAILEIVDTY
ncbi:hypothetical protein PR048_002966 [Dryococelus australis]|uniref:Amino acid transporter transmembrane domain-containing protein n=1 Tax=Dryococelus australis TaxID=614101 RepID=A0ABQ9ILR6_9NEOP|nr:hypothetical protein PR048_002966 [Dryococelus australis]